MRALIETSILAACLRTGRAGWGRSKPVMGARVYEEETHLQAKLRFVDGAALTAGFVVPVAAFVAWLSASGTLDLFIEQGLLGAVRVGLIAETYASTWIFVEQTLVRNPLLWGFGAGGAVMLVVEALRAAPEDRRGPDVALALFGLSMVLLIGRHTIKFPYVFVNVAPSLALCGAVPMLRLIQRVTAPGAADWSRILVATFGGALLFSSLSLQASRLAVDPRRAQQEAVMNRVEAITQPGDAVFDGIGIVVTRKKATPYSLTLRWMQERDARNHRDIIDRVRSSKTKVAIKNYRWNYLTKDEVRFLDQRFVADWGRVRVAGARIEHRGSEPTSVTAELIASGEYAAVVENHDVRIFVDDALVPGTVKLSAGVHRIRVEGAPQTVVLKLRASADVLLPTLRASRRPLFPAYTD